MEEKQHETDDVTLVAVEESPIRKRFKTDADFVAWCDEVDAHIARVKKRVAGA